MSILFGVLVQESDDFIKEHPVECDCSALKFAKTIKGLGDYVLQDGLSN
jgi:hypothetical protein